ncbi:MAG: hypothetical protein LJE60_11775 [Thiocapsa sp.]|jgi:hypothetical protein|nr:hypothetical protein [Thiocapsa sp.]MCG6897766.1 hypothetical protein [Thiocapsa sp.]
MHDTNPNSAAKRPMGDSEAWPEHPASVQSAKPGRRSLSMHEGVPVWCDCCSCEAEPYWVEAMGMDPGSNDEQPAR